MAGIYSLKTDRHYGIVSKVAFATSLGTIRLLHSTKIFQKKLHFYLTLTLGDTLVLWQIINNNGAVFS